LGGFATQLSNVSVKQKRRDEVSNRYLRVDEIITLDTSQPVLKICGSAEKIIKPIDQFIDCGMRHRVG
jgi:hypothetical protein